MVSIALLLLVSAAQARAAVDFNTEVAPLLARRCLDCHGRSEKKGGLDLSSQKSAQAGGDSGPAIVPGKLDESALWARVSQHEMPPKKPLPQAELDILKRWIEGGASWGVDPIDPFRYSSDNRAGYDWWSLQPVQRPALPEVPAKTTIGTPVDRFIAAGLAARGLTQAPLADKRTLIRRLSFDLLGLPQAPAEVEEFLADDSPQAYARLVERFLDSPHYGERWGRHWLDIVRFGESQGFERDRYRPQAWPYRDWVISAFNADLPYDEFVRSQIAGDVLHPDDPRGTIATGFLVAAPWDEVGQSQQSAAMKAVVRQDEMEDLLATTGQTFLGLTVNCARCHDHKFDPVSQTDYYRLAATLAGSRHGERDSLSAPLAPALASRRDELQRQEQEKLRLLADIDAPARKGILAARESAKVPPVPVPQPVARWEFDGNLQDAVGQLHGTAHGNARVSAGRLLLDGKDSYVDTPPLPQEITAKTLAVWVALANLEQRGGGAMTIQTLSGALFDSVAFGERDAGQWMAGSNGFSRWQSFQAPAETVAGPDTVCVVLVFGNDRTITAYRNGRRYGTPYAAPSLATYESGRAQILFGLRHTPPGGDRFIAGAIDRAALFAQALTADEVAALAGVTSDVITENQIVAALSAEQLQRRRQIQFDLSRIRLEQRLLSGLRTYAIAPAAPEPTFVLSRGNPAQKGEAVGPGAFGSLSGMSADLGIPADAPDALRRRRIAEWITDPHNPLTPRVIVNRLWHYHFGAGIVDTPNDFGFNGSRPSHPELLDWLASELMQPTVAFPSEADATPKAKPWSLKHIHRLIVHSAAYRQSSTINAQARQVDAGNRLVWRRNPQRLEAEALRDAILFVAGELNPQMGGPGYQDYRTFNFNSQFYEPIDPVGYEFNRRTVYRTWIRSGRNEFLDVFDCPDPSTAAPRRAVTTTPLQALALLNNSFTMRMAEQLAARIEREAGSGETAQVAWLYRLAFNRTPAPDESALARKHVEQHGLAALCRVVLNSNEFLYID
ncbi:MAG: DUF1553 domain-containing protein [Planctomycetes bacterium]|nr:DUF1553 domain-containing protein [Planctomycetota bacterium]